ncbi:hypothetical protein [Crocosphaera chwakensis]|uniref:Uncharacterized protein n=1 Tax=Crocosphaera chwakensis CCY0110 TaxID=391612 RepID=A3IPU5_9CHRO|nr:hypothetical protein [Crocosphaera chwakensis]EAZ91585.1 hypothetical protein CY0110_13731 [Crocosphaera chwakensis CCY0110]
MKSVELLLGFCLFFSSLNPILVQAKPLTTIIAQSDRTKRIQFDRGEISTTVEDAVIRGTRDIYLLGANAPQIMTVSLTSLENNAVFNLVSPNNIILKKEVTHTNLILPANGDYKIIVGGIRGNATYNLYVEIYDVVSTQTVKTENYKIILRSNCIEGAVTCNHVSYEGINVNTGDSIQLAGKTIHTTCADGLTPCRFLGYKFVNGDYVYFVQSDGSLLVYQENELILQEEGTSQN